MQHCVSKYSSKCHSSFSPLFSYNELAIENTEIIFQKVEFDGSIYFNVFVNLCVKVLKSSPHSLEVLEIWHF